MTSVTMQRETHSKAGLEDIKMLRAITAAENRPRKIKKTIVGIFGIGTGRNEIIMTWVVTDRKDKRHGFVGEPDTWSKHTKYELETMFKGWN